MQQASLPQPAGQAPVQAETTLESAQPPRSPSQREQPCPQCGYPMSDLKGGHDAICRRCGFKDSCCY